jgi:hypothetical protein|tara:strand:+ start:30 stop:200 length:171 start_codon:yes stop_codon:yes gene_type:complete
LPEKRRAPGKTAHVSFLRTTTGLDLSAEISRENDGFRMGLTEGKKKKEDYAAKRPE